MGLGRRGGWAALALGVTAVGALEAVVLHFLARAYLPPVAALCVDIGAGALTLAFVVAFASPLWGSIVLDESRFRLRFGWLATIEAPVADIVAVHPHRADAFRPAELGLDFDEETRLLSIVRSPSAPLIRVEFREPLPARTQLWRHVAARALLASIDDATRFEAAFEESTAGGS